MKNAAFVGKNIWRSTFKATHKNFIFTCRCKYLTALWPWYISKYVLWSRDNENFQPVSLKGTQVYQKFVYRLNYASALVYTFRRCANDILKDLFCQQQWNITRRFLYIPIKIPVDITLINILHLLVSSEFQNTSSFNMTFRQ